MAPLEFMNPQEYHNPFSRWRGRRQNKNKDLGPEQHKGSKQTRSTLPPTPTTVLVSTLACSTQLESIPEQAPDIEDHDQDESKINESDNNDTAVVTTAIDYQSVLSKWQGRNNESMVEQKPRSSYTKTIDSSNNTTTPSSRLSVHPVTPEENVPAETSIPERRSERNLPEERAESPSSQIRHETVDTLPPKPEADPSFQNEVSKIESGRVDTLPTQAKIVQAHQFIHRDVSKIQQSITTDQSPPSPVSVVDEGCNMPLHPAEQSAMVMLLKPSASTPLGINLACYGWRIVVSHIEETSLLFQSELQVGQTILAVNGMAASDFGSPQAILDALQVSRKVVIVATKSVLYTTTESAGLVLGKTSWNTLYISQLLVPNSTLRSGMTLIAINRTTDLDLRTANRILQEHQMGQTVRLSILALPTPMSPADASSSMTLYLDETCVTAQLLPSCPIEFRKHDDWRITIASIQNHPKLRVGQTVLAVNGVPANCFGSAESMKEMIGWSPALIFATNSILASVIKPNADTKVGIAFEFSSKGTLRIHQIDPQGLFSGKLKEGMKVIAINGNPCPRSLETASVMVKDCVGTLTIVAVDDEK